MFSRRVVKVQDPDQNKSLNDVGNGEEGGMMARMKKAQEEKAKEGGGVAAQSDFRRKREGKARSVVRSVATS